MTDGRCPNMSAVDILKATQQRTEPVRFECRCDAHWRHLANTTEPSVCGGDAACCQITLTTCSLYYLLQTAGEIRCMSISEIKIYTFCSQLPGSTQPSHPSVGRLGE